MNELQPLLDLLSAKHGWLASAVAWIGTLRVPLKLLQGKIQAVLSRVLAYVAETPEKDDDDFVRRLLSWWPYRLTALLADAVLSVKLPTVKTLDETFKRET